MRVVWEKGTCLPLVKLKINKIFIINPRVCIVASIDPVATPISVRILTAHVWVRPGLYGSRLVLILIVQSLAVRSQM